MSSKQRVLISYSTSHLLKKDKVRFFYALNGRNEMKGILPRTRAEHLGRAVLLIKLQFTQEFRDFLSYWKCEWKELNIWMK